MTGSGKPKPSSVPPPRIRPAGDRALLIEFEPAAGVETWRSVAAAFTALRQNAPALIVNLQPAESSILVVYDPLRQETAGLTAEIRRILSEAHATPTSTARVVTIPICYDGPCAPDLLELAKMNGLTEDEVVRAHSTGRYVVHFLGFTAGFPYLGGLPEQLVTPRLPTPRKRVPPGSVAIGGSWTGIYPFATPGGWRLIGRTPLQLFDAGREPAALLALGDEVRFERIACRENKSESERKA